MSKTLFDKIWDQHVVDTIKEGPQVLYIDKHLIHEVTSPQAFNELKERSIPIFRPNQIVATADHNTPTINQHLPIKDKLSKNQLEQLSKNCFDNNITLYELGHKYNGIVHVMAPELGITQPGMTMVCGDSHTSTHGAFGAIAFGIYNYIRHTHDTAYLAEYGRPVLIGIARFWAQRFNWSTDRNAFVMLGVTGPNEYENNVNNNWYTNYIARWCIEYALKVNADLSESIGNALTEKEITDWKKIVSNVYFPKIENSRVFLQQDGFLDKELLNAQDIPESERPINQNWSWDRILRSVFIKQADVLQGLYLFEDHFDSQTIQDNFNFYEPKTVHESSLSPCVHVILAAKIGMMEKAYELYLRTSRLDLDDYNNDTEDGCHITSMAGTWMSIVKGFGGMTIKNDQLNFDPFLPSQWDEYAFKINFRLNQLAIKIHKQGIDIDNLSDKPITLKVKGKAYTIKANSKKVI